jgi:Putative Ig domain
LTDGSQPAQTRSVAIKVSDPLAVPTTGLPSQLAKSAPTSFTVTSTGGRSPITWSITNLPAGLTATGATINGTPSTVETKTVSVQATDADGRTKTSTFSLQVVDVTPIAVTVTAVPQTPTVGQTYTGNVTASGGIAPLTYTASNLPAGLSLNATTGALSGTPASPGLFTVVFRVNGGFGSTGTATRVIGVQNSALTATVATLPASIDQGVAVNPTAITVTGGTPALDGSYNRRLRVCGFNCTSLVASNSSSLTLDDIDGIVGPVTMTTPGDYWVSVVVTDAADRQVASNVQKITVTPRLTVNTTNLATSVNKRAYYVADLSQAYTAESGKTYAWSATGLPPGVTLNTTTSKLEGTVTTAGTYNAVITLAETTTATTVTRVASAQYAISVAPRPDVISVSAGVDHSCAVYAEYGYISFDTRPQVGRVLCWGHANNGQLGRKFGTGEPSTGDLAPVEVTDANGTTLTTVVSVGTSTSTTAGQQFSCSNGAADATIDGTTSKYYVWCWGYGGNGQLGADEFGTHAKIAQSNSAVPVQLWRKRVSTIAATGATTETWTQSTGNNTFSGALNVGTDAVCSTSGICVGPDSVTSGSNEVQTVINTYRNYREFRGDSGWAFDVTSGDGFVCQVMGSVQCQGDNSMGQLGNGTTTAVSAPNWTTPAGAGGGQYARVFSAGKYACSLPDAYNGSTPVCWGDNTGTQLGRTTGDNKAPGAVKKTDGSSLTSINHLALGVGGGCATTLSGEYWCWGKWGSTAVGTVGLAVKVGQGPSYWDQWNPSWGADLPGYRPGLGYPSPIAVHQDHVIYIDANGIVRSFGDNDHKQLNRGSDPTPATDPTGTTDI